MMRSHIDMQDKQHLLAPASLLGRDHATELIAQLAVGAAAGSPSILCVAGETGSGKSILVRQAVSDLADFTIIWTPCHWSERDRPFALADVLTTRLFALGNGPNDVLPARAPEVADQVLHKLIISAQRTSPVCLVIEDVQWIDDKSLRALGYALRRLQDERVLVITTSTVDQSTLVVSDVPPITLDQFQAGIGAAAAPFVHVPLSPLTVEQMRVLARYLRGEPDQVLLDHLAKFSHGNLRIARSLIDASDQNGASDGDAAIPQSIVTALSESLGAVPPSARRLLDVLAVLNNSAPLSLVVQISAVDDYIQALSYLLERRLVTWRPAAEPVSVSVSDPMVGAALYQLLSPQKRREFHSTAARWVVGEERWRHRAAAAMGVDSLLATELEEEALLALERDEFAWAIKCMQWAGDLSAEKSEHDRRLLVAAILDMWWDCDKPGEQYRSAIFAADPSAYRSCALGLFYSRRADKFQDAIAALENCLEWPEGLVTLPMHMAMLPQEVLAHIHITRGDARRALPFARAVVDNAETTHTVVVVRAVRALLLATFYLHGAEDALAMLDALEADVLTQLVPSVSASVFDFEKSLFCLMNGRLSDAVDLASSALRVTEHIANNMIHRVALVILIEAQRLLGDWPTAIDTVELALRQNDPKMPPTGIATAHLVAATLAAESGKWPRAEYHIGMLTRISVDSEVHRELHLAIARAGLHRARGEFQLALEFLDEASTQLSSQTRAGVSAAYEAIWRPLLCEVLIETGSAHRAQAEVKRLSRLSEHVVYLQMSALWLAGRLAERLGNKREALRHYERAVSLPTDRNETPMSRALAEMAYGRMLLRLAQRSKGLLWLDSARRRFTRLGAMPFLATCEELIGDSHFAMSALLNGLTERENAVAELVSSGLTNSEAAAKLFVSEKTIEYHLGNIFAKLGISSRKQLRLIAKGQLDTRRVNGRHPST